MTHSGLSKIVATTGLVMCGVLGSNDARAIGGEAAAYALGLKTGIAQTCVMCEGAMANAFTAINQSIVVSEQVIGRAINDGIYRTAAPIGFPMLQTVIQTTTATDAANIVGALDAMLVKVGKEVRNLPMHSQQLEEASKAPFVQAQSERGCVSATYGQNAGGPTRSSLGWGWQWLNYGTFANSLNQGGGNGAVEIPPLTDEQAVAQIAIDGDARARQEINADFQALKERAVAAGQPDDVSIMDILNPAILVSNRYRSLGTEKDEYGMSDDERADFLIQYLSMDAPSYAEGIMKASTTMAGLNTGTELSIGDMSMGSSMAVLDDHIKMRRKQGISYGGESYLANAMGEAETVNSGESLLYQVTHYRQRDPEWVAQVAVDDRYALSQAVQMEAEHLWVKYERWVQKRNSNLMLAQVLANQLKQER